MAFEDIVGSTLVAIGEALGLIVNAILRKFGFSELDAEKIVSIFLYSFVALFILGLFYITFKYS